MVAPVVAVVAQVLRRPLPADENAASAVAEMTRTVRFRAAAARPHPRARVLGLDAVLQPVRALWGARFVPQFLDQSSQVIGPPGRRVPAAVSSTSWSASSFRSSPRSLTRYLTRYPIARSASGDPARTPLTSSWVPNRTVCRGSVVVPDAVESLLPGQERLPGDRVPVAGALLIPDGQVLPAVDHRVRVRPPHVDVRRRREFPNEGAGQGPADRVVRVRSSPPLRFDGGEVLHVIARDAAQVLMPPVQQLAHMQGIPCRPPVVIPARIHRTPITMNPPIGRQGQGDEQGRPERPPATGVGERPPQRRGRRGPTRQVRHVIPPPGRPLPPSDRRHHRTPGPRRRQRRIQVIDPHRQLPGRLVVPVSGIVEVVDSVFEGLRGSGAFPDQLPLLRRGRVGDEGGFFGQVPALPALLSPQPPSPIRTRRTRRFPGRPTRNLDDEGFPGLQIGPQQQHRTDTDPELHRRLGHHVPSPRTSQPIDPRPRPHLLGAHARPPHATDRDRGRGSQGSGSSRSRTGRRRA